ncbi:MAG: sporulation transcriptional regulator SpoIIID [Clostridia bacterium]|nr:sporulation transcriptional regulator SpoIIID [Clostridia bacterium]MDE7329026.1 sporulation transcriptional regulator SpoIIID [Clostridia bacterium]
MRDNYSQSILTIADYIIKTRCTVRECASVFGISKSAVHSYMHTKLKYIDVDAYDEVQKVLNYNLSVRHLRGGESTRRKYFQGKADLATKAEGND